MGTQNNKPLIRFTVNIPLKYNVSNVLHDEQDSEFVTQEAMPLSQLFEVLFDSSVVVKYLIF